MNIDLPQTAQKIVLLILIYEIIAIGPREIRPRMGLVIRPVSKEKLIP